MTLDAATQGRRAATHAGLSVRLDDLSLSFSPGVAPSLALRGLTLDIPAGSLTVVIGPNGCGKSTLLRLIAGLLRPTSGSVLLGDGEAGAPPRAGDGRVGLAFQQPRLVPWLSILDNVALPLTLRGIAAAEGRERAREALAWVGLAEAAPLRPAQLSGGMAQRAGLARALISNPPILLLDEPFTALDALTREAFDGELQRLWMDRPRTVVLVTHSVSEAVRMADRIVVMTARPGSVARVVPVDLARPRPAAQAGVPAAVAIDRAVRATLADVHPAELTPWVDR
ncbi:MAG: ABC transporter ATP-binding protein [Chloroflexota bacterium]|nr:ABC transporter ATP-binding protein [Chloroflexota bacterium]